LAFYGIILYPHLITCYDIYEVLISFCTLGKSEVTQMVFCLFWCQHLFPSLHDSVQTFYRLQGIQDTVLVPVFMSVMSYFCHC